MTTHMIPTLTYRHKLFLIALLNVADFFLTWQLWRRGSGQLPDETHPIVQFCLSAYGWMGLAGFQGVVILFVGALFVIASRFRPRFGEGGLSFLCLVLSSIVTYHCCLAGMPSGQALPERTTASASEETLSHAIDRELQQIELYHQRLYYWTEKLVRQGCSLSEATRQVQQTERAQDRRWLARMRWAYGKDNTDEACLAINILMHCASRLLLDDNLSRAHERAGSLQAEFEAIYKVCLPPLFKQKITLLDKGSTQRLENVQLSSEHDSSVGPTTRHCGTNAASTVFPASF